MGIRCENSSIEIIYMLYLIMENLAFIINLVN